MRKKYHLNGDSSFIIEDYQQAKAFSNFFPGVAGLYGIPMWAFYVNRGQAISSFGIESKDKAILEFQPANKAYRYTSTQGFRTFLKITDGQKVRFYEPFSQSARTDKKIVRRMTVNSHDLTIEEINPCLGLSVAVNYFPLPQEPFAALVRRVTVTNRGTKDLEIQMVDGLPAINPYGLTDWLAKHMSRTVEAWMAVQNLSSKAPFYQLKVVVADTPQVTHIEEGNFYFAFDADSQKLADMVVEGSCIFGQATDFLVPDQFIQMKNFKVPARQETANRTPSALSVSRMSLKRGGSKTLVALAGFAHDLSELNTVVKKATRKGYITAKAQENRELIDGIKGLCFTQSAFREFDQYVGQNFLDNVLRGGLPFSMKTAQGPVSFNVFTRKHGDPERDYNFFKLSPTFLSQGNGNFRDVNQNRRNDVYFNRDVKDSAVINFFNLQQADGYNPLVIKGVTFCLKSEAAAESLIKEFSVTEGAGELKRVLVKGFMPGDLLELISRRARIKGTSQEFLSRALGLSLKQETADAGEGFWTDHWTYNLDLLESYIQIYPESLRELLLDKKVFTFYLNDHYVLPRHQRYVLNERGVRQYHSLQEHDQKVNAQHKGHRLRAHDGEWEVIHANLLVKLVCVLANKAATLDPSGIGIEMEANKPNWYDALNGLPGLLGSSISETFEVKRFARFILDALDLLKIEHGVQVDVFVELADFVEGLTHLLHTQEDPLSYWDKANDLKEHYRQSIRYGVKGANRTISIGEIRRFLQGAIVRCDQGIARARYKDGTFATYFTHEVTRWEVLGKSHHGDHVRALAFKRHDLPLFLEGFVHALRGEQDSAKALDLFKAVRKSALYDRKLGMYRVNADLSKESEEIGRARIFPNGWLENGSIWLHMEYKYLLELLRCGLYKEFFSELKACWIPFLAPEVYGRSVLENSSFIVSSLHEDQKLHGQGFVARLSGSTAEILHMWLIMCAGSKPFTRNDQGELILELKPVLPANFFTTKPLGGLPAKTYAFQFLGSTRVVYHNPKMKDTFGPAGVKPCAVIMTYAGSKKAVHLPASGLTGATARDVREGRVTRLDIILE